MPQANQTMMSSAQMNWCLDRGFAWFEKPDQEWNMPIWTRRGGWMWSPNDQMYFLEIV